MNRILVLITQLFTAMSIMFISLGMDWINSAHGLQPVLAGACALSFLLLPYWVATYVFNDQAEAPTEQEKVNADWLRLHPRKE